MIRNNYQMSEDSVTKISRSKSRNQVAVAAKLKEKESGWNQRFHLDQIPQYNYHNQPHSQYLKNKFRIPSRKNDLSKAKRLHEPSLQKNKVSNKPNPRRNQQRHKQAITKAFSDLKSLWYENQIPQCHMEAMTKIFNRENNPMKILDDIKYEYSQISKETSLIQKVVSSISSRQNCLQKINQLIVVFENTDKNKLLKEFQQKISHLRILTIHCIQCIFHWKQSIQSAGPRNMKVKYTIDGKPYTNKVKEDYSKIINSQFKQLYKFDPNKTDAFFLNYSYEGKKVSNVSKNLVKRMRLCEIMLNQDQQNQPEVKRTPIMQKIKSPPKHQNYRQKSLPPRGKTPNVIPWTKVPVEYGQFHQYINNMLSKGAFFDSFSNSFEMMKYIEYTVYRFSQTEQQIVLAVQKNTSQRKIVILALKSNYQSIQSLLKNCCEYLWQHDSCNQIRISLMHSQKRQNFSVDIELQKRVKLVGFRWTSVNHSNDIRITTYAIKRPLNTVAHKTSKRIQSYPVIIQHLVNFSLAQRKQKKEHSKCFASALDLITQVSKSNDQDYQQICRRDQFSHHLDCLNRINDFMKKQAAREGRQPDSLVFEYSGMRSFNVDNQETLEKIFRNIEIPVKSATSPSTFSLLNTSFRFGHVTIQDGKYTKFFPTKQSEILICQSNYPIYLLQTDEENINFFVIEVNESFSMSSVENIFNSMGQQSSFIDEFWLPIFYKSEQYVDQVGFSSSEIISTNYRNCLSSLTRKSKVRTKIIKAPFVFGMINKRLLEMLQIPFYCTLVRKEDLV